MRRLYLQIYVTFVGILFLFGLLLSAAWLLYPGDTQEGRMLEGFGILLGERLPAPERPAAELQYEIDRLSRIFRADVAVRGGDGALLAASGGALPVPPPDRAQSGFVRARGGRAIFLRLPDGRWLVARSQHAHRPYGWPAALAALLLAIAIGAYPIVRRITRRLERLRTRVDALGAGELSTRVEIEGRDEVADLARSFNRAAERIERLVSAQRTMLLGASHELRTPLARMRVALELLQKENRADLREKLTRDIAELDELIAEILLASRLDALDGVERTESVDLLALVAEEAVRVGAEVSGTPVQISGDPRLLRRLIRNLLENARRYAAGSAIEVSVASRESGALLRVADHGPGVPAGERELIFEPFYRSASTREGAEGYGLGLALVRQIARHHDGDARCAPRDGGGTCFEIELRSVQSKTS